MNRLVELSRKKGRTVNEVAELRGLTVDSLLDHERRYAADDYGAELSPLTNAELALRRLSRTLPFTCDNCNATADCEHAFDSYNTDGDCLASK